MKIKLKKVEVVIPAEAGIQVIQKLLEPWIPVFTGMTRRGLGFTLES
jgi:hypothetical protein